MKNKEDPLNKSIAPNQSFQNGKTKIALHTHHGILMEEIKSIIHCQSDNSYTTFHLDNEKKIVVSKPITDFENILSGKNFLRIHKSHLINLHFVKEYIRGKGGQVRMSDGTMIDVSPMHKAELLDLLDKL